MENIEYRIKFKKGMQRKFLKEVIKNTNCPSLRSISQFGINIPYSTLKNYYTNRRLLPISLYEDLCIIAKINKSKFKTEKFQANWGKIKGGINKAKKNKKI